MLTMPHISLNIVYFIACPWMVWRSIEAVTTLTWPAGKYGLPKAKVGCPLSTNSEWVTGWRYEDTEDENPTNIKSPSFHLDAIVGADINRTFCIKKNDINKSPVVWPPGQYCIYKKGNCPKGLKEGYIHWDDETDKNINDKGGTLPDGVYDRDTKIYYCCRTDGDKFTPMPLPLISPFYLKTYNSSECQRVEGAISTEEYIRYDTEDESNIDKQNGSYPYGGGINNHNISYCYYESFAAPLPDSSWFLSLQTTSSNQMQSKLANFATTHCRLQPMSCCYSNNKKVYLYWKGCLYTYSLDNNETVAEFISPKFFGEGFPYSQKCKWRFVVPQNKQLKINFLEVHLEGGDTISIHNGWDSDSGTLLGTIKSGERPEAGGYSSQGNKLTLEFESEAPDPSRKRSRGFRGTFKVLGSKEVGPAWPKGTYGLPRPSLGCPLSNAPKWKTGWRFQDTEDTSPSNEKSDSFHMDTVVNKSVINKTFCIATDAKRKGPEWPKGQYCIYKKGTCSKGFSEGYIFFDDENHKNINDKGGTLPDGVYNKDTNISYCCRTDGDKLKPITLPVMSPFYLMAYNTSECQRVKGALATEEFIRYDNQDTDNKDSMNGTHPYEEGKKNITIMYCYYEACHFTISEKSQEFMSPNYLTDGYPNSQICSWRILVEKASPQTEQILIKFPEFNLQKGEDGDKVTIYSGWNETAPLLAEFNGNRPPDAKGVASESPVVYVVFTSDSQGRSKGFRGLFLNQNYSKDAVPTKPITIPTEITQPTASTNKKSTSNKTPTAGKQTGAKSSVSIGIIIPVVLAVVIVGAMVSVYCIRRKRMEQRVRKTLSQSKLVTVSNDNYTYRDLDTQDDGSIEELEDIFPAS